MQNQPIYLDYNATTPVDERVLEAMLPYFSQRFGNPASSTHLFGWQAKEAVELGRERVAKLINATPDQLIFTSGATESINIALKGVAERYASKGNHIITCKTEHKAVLDTCAHLEQHGTIVTYLDVDREGLIDIKTLEEAITENTILVCIMYANNETGVIQNISAIGELCRAKNVLFMTDATQALGKVRVDVDEDKIDILCCSAHKLYGPKGVGALFIRRRDPRVSIPSMVHGGGHEKGIRSGTLNVPGIVGFGKAAEIAADELWDDAARMSAMRTILEQHLTDNTGAHINGSIRSRLPNTTNISFSGVTSEILIRKVRHVAMATGSACTSAVMEPSHVLKAMGINDEKAYASVRLSLGRFTTKEEIARVIEMFTEIL
jgi:cysteine desulfurase